LGGVCPLAWKLAKPTFIRSVKDDFEIGVPLTTATESAETEPEPPPQPAARVATVARQRGTSSKRVFISIQ
jgi:hypothetical protein